MEKMRTLSSIRITEQTFENMKSAIRKYNIKSLVKMTQSQFRRLAIETLSQAILRNISLPISFKT